MSRLSKFTGLTALTLALGLTLTGCTTGKTDASPTPGVKATVSTPAASAPAIRSGEPTPTATPRVSASAVPASSDKAQVAASAERLFNGLFHTSPATAKKVVALDGRYTQMKKADFIKQVEAYVPSLKELQHEGQTESDIADAEYALTVLTMPTVEAANPTALKNLQYHVDATKVKLAANGREATVPPSAFYITLNGKESRPSSSSGADLRFGKVDGRWGVTPEGLAPSK